MRCAVRRRRPSQVGGAIGQTRNPRGQGFVVISATGFSAETIRAQFGEVDLLPKPVPYSDLLARLGRARGVRSSAA